ncbi:MAG: ferrochelatase [Cyanobacteriota/Melainabacteria group bacterium]
MKTKYDALLVVSFGGPEGMDDVIPFLENVLRGRNVPKERMMAVAKHYEQFGGISPINQQVRDLIKELEKALDEKGPALPIYWGNRNWHPMLADTLKQMRKDGIKNALYFVTAAYGSYSSCRQYRENVEEALATSGGDSDLNLQKLRIFFNHPGFIETNTIHLKESLAKFQEESRQDVAVLFSAHSIPTGMAERCHYEEQLNETARLVASKAGHERFEVVYQSRSGPPTQPWLEPDILDRMKALHEEGVNQVVVLPIGFISDHMEVVYDLDTEARALAQELGMDFVRAATVSTHPVFIEMIRELICEQVEGLSPRFEGSLGLLENQCDPECCKPAPRPAISR